MKKEAIKGTYKKETMKKNETIVNKNRTKIINQK